MKTVIFSILAFLFLYTPNLFSQEKVFKNKKVIRLADIHPDSVERVREIVKNRERSLHFFETTTTYSDPSIISFIPFGVTYNLNRQLQKKMFILDADIRTPIALGGKKWYSEKIKIYNAIHVIPRFMVRIFQNDVIFNDKSMPVRTPSYIPTIRYFITHQSLWKMDKSTKNYFSIEAFHHSNGQDGDEFINDTINIYNGNFGENLAFEFAVRGYKDFKEKPPEKDTIPQSFDALAFRLPTGTQKRDHKTTKEKLIISEKIFWKAGLEWHPKALTNQVFLDEQMYGRFRLNAQFGYLYAPEKRELISSSYNNESIWVAVEDWGPRESVRLIADFSYILDSPYFSPPKDNPERINFLNLKKRLNLEGAVYWRIKGTPSSALFGKISYWGSDPYNIYFQQSLFSIKIGIALNKFIYSPGK